MDIDDGELVRLFVRRANRIVLPASDVHRTYSAVHQRVPNQRRYHRFFRNDQDACLRDVGHTPGHGRVSARASKCDTDATCSVRGASDGEICQRSAQVRQLRWLREHLIDVRRQIVVGTQVVSPASQ
jgi:hypothetical protein